MKTSHLFVESKWPFDTIGPVGTFSSTIDQTTYSDQRVGCRRESKFVHIFCTHIVEINLSGQLGVQVTRGVSLN